MLPIPKNDVVMTPVEDGAVLFSAVDEVYYALNSVGLRVWELLPPSTWTLDELCDSLRATYPDVEPDRLRADVVELLGELVTLSLATERAVSLSERFRAPAPVAQPTEARG